MATSTRTLTIVTTLRGNATPGLQEMNRAVNANTSSLGLMKGALGALGIGLTAKAAVDLTKSIVASGQAWQTARAAVEATTGSLAVANATIEEAQAATDGLVSKTDAAIAVNTFFRNGLAQTGAEAGKLAQTGQILSSVYEAQGATFEKYIRFLSTGNIALADNFNLTVGQINALSDQIQSTEGLSKAEADLEARKRLLNNAAEAYIETMPESSRAMLELKANTEDLAASIGNELQPALIGSARGLADFTGWLNDSGLAAAFTRDILRILGAGIERVGITADVTSSSMVGLGATYGTVGDAATIATKATEAYNKVIENSARLALINLNNLRATNEATERLHERQAALASSTQSRLEAINRQAESAALSHQSGMDAINRQAEDAERDHGERVAAIRQQMAETANRGIEARQQRLNSALESLADQHASRIQSLQDQLTRLNDSYLGDQAEDAEEHQDDIDDLTLSHNRKRDEILRRLRNVRTAQEGRELRAQLAAEDAAYADALAKLERDFDQEVDRNQKKHDDQEQALKDRVTAEDAEYKKQQGRIKRQAREDLDRIKAENAERMAGLQARLAEEEAAYARRQEDIQRQRDEELANYTRQQAEMQRQREEASAIQAAQNAKLIADFDKVISKLIKTTSTSEAFAKAQQDGAHNTIVMLGELQHKYSIVKEEIDKATRSARDFANSQWGGGPIGGSMSFQSGTPFVPSTGMAMVHRGEAVIPAGMNPFASRGGGGGSINVYLTYSPIVSLADRYEAETKLVPFIQAALRSQGMGA